MFDLYKEEEERNEALKPYRSYRTVLFETASAVARLITIRQGTRPLESRFRFLSLEEELLHVRCATVGR